MGYEDFTAGEIIRQEFGAMGYLNQTGGNNNRIIGYNGLTAAGQNLMSGGNLDSNYDYNVFDNSADVGNDTSYMGIMYNGSASGGSPTASMSNTPWKMDWSNSTFDLAHTYANPGAFSGVTQSGTTGTSQSGTTGTTKSGTKGTTTGNNGVGKNFDLAHTYANPVPSGGTTNGTVASDYTGYKMEKDTDGSYCATYYINGQRVQRETFAPLYKEEAAKAMAELKRLNGQS